MILGIKPGMVMQRNAQNVCQITFQTASAPETAPYTGAVEGCAQIEPLGGNRFQLTGIPAGGPYTLTVGEESFEDIYVGDLWILAGQSNMEGVGHMTAEDLQFQPQPDVRALFMKNYWGPAQVPLHDLGGCHFKVHDLLFGMTKPTIISVGPGISFSLQMRDYTGVPQGLICCAHGATNLHTHWDPAIEDQGTDKSLYAAMHQRVIENGDHVRGLFWYQGCSDAEGVCTEDYFDNMVAFVAACRRDFGENLPFVQVQIGRTISRPNADFCRWWNQIQEQQRRLTGVIPCFATLSAISKELDDRIHLSSASQKELGAEAAEAMYFLAHGYDEKGCLPPPEFDSWWFDTDPISGWALLRLRYRNLHGGLTAPGRAMGFEVFGENVDQLPQLVFKTTLEQDVATLHLGLTVEEARGMTLYYGYSPDPACNITDMAGRAIPVMGPITL